MYIIDLTTLQELRLAKQVTEKIIAFQWNFYSELAHQRNLIQDEIKQALISPSISYNLINWQRAVKYKYGLHPLSTQGSLIHIGGRFNTGLNVNTEVPTFSGLYLAEDKDTALQEHLGQTPPPKGSKLTSREIALTNPSSETIVSVSGKLDKVFDLTNRKNLEMFMQLIKNFKLSSKLKRAAKRLNISQPTLVNSSQRLLNELLNPNWRIFPNNYDIPATSQIFGHQVYATGIEGILYPSKLTKKLCIVIFPRNFSGTDSYIELDDDLPHPRVPNRIDSANWRVTEMDINEII